MFKRFTVSIALVAILSAAFVGPASAALMTWSTEQLARLAEAVPDATARIPGVPTEFTLVAERYYEYEGSCAVERTYVWTDEYRLFRHHTKSYWC